MYRMYIELRNYVCRNEVVKLWLCTTWRHTGGTEVCVHSFLTSALDWAEWWAPRPGHSIDRKGDPGTQWRGDFELHMYMYTKTHVVLCYIILYTKKLKDSSTRCVLWMQSPTWRSNCPWARQESVCRSRCTVPFIFNFDTRWSLVSFTSRPLYTWINIPRVRIE
jgi:hypothetical protein